MTRIRPEISFKCFWKRSPLIRSANVFKTTPLISRAWQSVLTSRMVLSEDGTLSRSGNFIYYWTMLSALLKACYQLDINFSWDWGKRRAKHHFSLGFKNFYNRKNPVFSIIYRDLENPEPSDETNEYFSMPIFPSIRYSIRLWQV